MIKHQFLQDAFKNGFVEFAKGQSYEPSERTAVYVATGVAQEVEVTEAAPGVKEPKAKKTTKK